MSPFISRSLLTIIITTGVWTRLAIAADVVDNTPTLPPKNEQFLGRQSYIPVVIQKLAHPKLVYTDIPQDQLSSADKNFLLNKWGWAVRTPNEPADAYLQPTRVHSASFYGGNGMNGNIGDGRATVAGDENFKGIGPTGMVNPYTEVGHNSGTLKIDHAILEAVWSKLLDLELPYGANRLRGILSTGTIEDRDGYPGTRVVIVRDDFLRPAHFITNETSVKVGRAEADRERVRQAILHLPEALPQPAGLIISENRANKLTSGLREFIDRLAIQTAYSWSHSMYHGAMSPSNVTLQGAAADFGTFQALGGYPSVQLLSDCSPNGDYSEELQVLKEFYTSLIENSPAQWKSAIGNFSDWTQRFQQTYQRRAEKEMLSLSGAFPEFIDSLATNPDSHHLADLLIQIAKAGNEVVLQTWVTPLSYNTGTYSLPRILEKMAEANLNEHDLLLALQTEIGDVSLRTQLAKAYLNYYQKMNALAANVGIQSEAAQGYRIEAAKIRNRKMTDLFRTPEMQQQLNTIVQNYSKSGDSTEIRNFIEQKVNASRRNFKDAAPFTVVSHQTLDEKTGRITRQVYDAKTGRSTELTLTEVTPLEKILRQQVRGHGVSRCDGLFLAH